VSDSFREGLASAISMPYIHVGFSQLKRSFNRMRAESMKGDLPHNHLLLFYAAECSLKAILVRSKGARTTAGLGELTHSFSTMLRELGIPPAAVSPPPRFKLRSDTSKTFDSGLAHQAWRYGADLDALDEEKLVKWLISVCTFSEGRI
jgi:hypothetical protein